MRRFFAIPSFRDAVQEQLARLLSLHLSGMILGYTGIAVLLAFILPWAWQLGTAMTVVPLAVNLALLALAKRGRLRMTALSLVVEIWLIITLFAFLPGGLGARAAWGFFIIVFDAGMLLGGLASLAALLVSSLTTLAIACFSQPPSPHPWTFWLINTLYLAAMINLQHLASSSIRAALAKTINELHERQQAQTDLANSEKKHREMVNSLPFCVFESDLDGRVRFVNQTGLDWFGYSPADLAAGFNVFQILESSDVERAKENIRRLLSGEELVYREYRVRRRDGRVFTALIRTQLISENGVPAGLQGSLIDISDRKQAEKDRELIISLLRATVESTTDGILVIDLAGRIAHFNRRFKEMWRIPDEVLASGEDEKAIAFVCDQLIDPPRFVSRVKQLYTTPLAESFDELEFKDGRYFERYSQPQMLSGEPVGRVWSFHDVSERKKLEEQLLQAQKMEAVGILAGGVAHDFNNILSTIVGYGSLLQMRMQEDPQLREYIEKILDSCDRAVRLTSSLLTFSRKQEIELQPIDINDAIFSFHKILARLIGEDIDFHINLASQALVADADVRQIEQVLMNLATNSRDAMPHGGRLTISTAAVDFNKNTGEIPRGAYAAIAVADSGSGMEKNVEAHIFEPFFTTKEVGKGTGLGLAIVYGIVKKHGGFITVASAPGQGTTFTIYLPLKAPPKKGARRRKPERIPSGDETILLIEDDPAVRQVTRSILEEFGYSVLEAADGEMGQEVFRNNQERIHLILCDLIMPKRNGRETIAAIQKIRPGAKAIFMSGYTSDVIAGKGIADAGAHLLLKPLNPSVLLKKVRDVLDGW